MAKRPIGVVVLLVAASGVAEAGPIRKHPRPIPGSYIVVWRQDVSRSPKDTISRLPSVDELATEMVTSRTSASASSSTSTRCAVSP